MTRRALTAPAAAPTAVPPMRAAQPPAVIAKASSRLTSASVARIAATMPEALNRLPRLAVAGERMRCRPSTKVVAATR